MTLNSGGFLVLVLGWTRVRRSVTVPPCPERLSSPLSSGSPARSQKPAQTGATIIPGTARSASLATSLKYQIDSAGRERRNGLAFFGAKIFGRSLTPTRSLERNPLRNSGKLSSLRVDPSASLRSPQDDRKRARRVIL